MIEKQITPQDLNPPAIVEEVKISWEELHTRWEALRESDDNTQIESGKLALYTKKYYGKDGVLKMAIETNIAKNTIAERMKVVKTFDDTARAEYSRLSYSHLRLCSRQKEPFLWAEKCMNNNWTIENLVMELKPGKKAINVEQEKNKIIKVVKNVREQGTADNLSQLMLYIKKITLAWEEKARFS